jgi:hypothetical protein
MRLPALAGLSLGLSLVAPAGGGSLAHPASQPLVLERTIPLTGVGGRIDHLAVDLAHQRLFIAELGNGSVDAVDLAGGPARRITGLKEPQGLLYLPSRDELVVASGGDGTVRFYRGKDLAPLEVMQVGDDADNLRLDKSGNIVVGYGGGALAVSDPASRKTIKRLALKAHPESFRFDGDRVFINVPDANAIVVGDMTTGKITATWKASHRWNFPLAYDAGTIAVVYRLPSRLVMMDAASGVVKSDTETCGDADDVFFDAKRQRLYVSCGSGAVDVVDIANGYKSISRVPTRSGARTALFAPELDRLFVAARAGLGESAAILVYRPAS